MPHKSQIDYGSATHMVRASIDPITCCWVRVAVGAAVDALSDARADPGVIEVVAPIDADVDLTQADDEK